MKTCTDCKLEKEISDFYKSKSHSQGVMCYCKGCFNKRCQKRWIARKLKAITYKGSQCTDCMIHIDNSHYSIFEFHHLIPSEKDYDWTQLRMMTWSKVLEELDKCVLLCANCHRIRHADL